MRFLYFAWRRATVAFYMDMKEFFWVIVVHDTKGKDGTQKYNTRTNTTETYRR